MSNDFPVWKTVKRNVNGQEFEIDLVKTTLRDLGFNTGQTHSTVVDFVESFGLSICDEDLVRQIRLNDLPEFNEIIFIGECRMWKLSIKNRVIVNFPNFIYILDTDEIVLIQPRALKATAGAPLQVA